MKILELEEANEDLVSKLNEKDSLEKEKDELLEKLETKKEQIQSLESTFLLDLFIYSSICKFILSMYLSIYILLFIHLSIYLFFYLFIYLFI